MRALILDEHGPRLVTDRPEPPMSSDPDGPAVDALVRVLRSGLGWLDLAAVSGRVPHSGVLGHEIVGRVESAPSQKLVGGLVAVAPEVACGSCDLCRAGIPSHCRHLRLLGFGGTDGGMADRIAVPARNLCPVPEGIELDTAVLAQPVADAVHVARMVPIERKTFVTVIGDGLGALVIAQILARRNASVRLLGARPERFGLCERWQVRHRDIREAGMRADQDVVVACFDPGYDTTHGMGLPPEDASSIAIGMLRPRGTLVAAGPAVPVPGAGLDLSRTAGEVVAKELRIVGARRGRIADGLAAIANNEVELAPLITSRARLDDGVAILRTAADPAQLRTVVEVAA
ncbi:MAG: alcohol dehydrogenase catalytic domain-containing protein [Planctomycetota bacterium]